MENLKRHTERLRIKRFYTIKSNKGRGYIAIVLDKFIFRLFIFSSLFIYIYIKLRNILMTLVMSVVGMFLYSFFAYKNNNRKFKEDMKIVNKELIVEKVYKKLISKSTDDYVGYIKDILSNYGIENMKKTIRKDLDLIGTLNSSQVGIKCYQYSEEHKVDKNDMKNFFIEIRDKNINKGIIITTSSFSEDGEVFFDNMDNMEIEFMTIDNIIEIIKDTSLYPKEKDLEEMILKELDDTRLKTRLEGKKIVSKDNIKRCVITGVLIVLFSKITKYTLYYKLTGMFLISLGLMPIISSGVNLILSGNTINNIKK